MAGVITKKYPRRTEEYPENEPCIAKVLPGNANYADLTKEGKRRD